MMEVAKKISYWQAKLKSSRSKAFRAQLEVLAKEEGYASVEEMKEAVTARAKELGTTYAEYVHRTKAIEDQYLNGARFDKLKKDLMSRRWA